MKKNEGFKIVFVIMMLLIIYAPILILAVYSFTDAGNIGASGHFSLENYKTLFTMEELRNMICSTMILAITSAVLSTILGTVGAIGTFYSRKRTRKVVETLNQIPIINADVVTGFSICILLVIVFGCSRDTYIPLICGHVTLGAPFVYLSVMPKLKQMDGSLYEAALDLGASAFYALRKVVIPQISSGIIAGLGLVFTLSLDDYFITTYTKPSTFDTISTYVVNATKGSQTQIKTSFWALSTVIFLIVVLVVVFMNISSSKKTKREAGDI